MPARRVSARDSWETSSDVEGPGIVVATSAGAAAGLDLCLHLIRRDHGSAVAADAARLSVMALECEGEQAQFIVHDQPPTPQGSVLRASAAPMGSTVPTPGPLVQGIQRI